MKKFLLLIQILWLFPAFSQVDNNYPATDSIKLSEKRLELKIRNLSFLKNNEYFNLIADGYTLFGNRLNPELVYHPHPDYHLKAGVMLLKYYGLDDFTSVVPYFSLFIKKGNHKFYFGKLNSGGNHYLSRQLYDYERQLDARSIENGIQHRYKNKHWVTDTWLEWEHFIQKYDDERERLNFGHFSRYKYTKHQWRVFVPFQLYVHHRGGQINKRTQATTGLNNALVVANVAVGLSLNREISKDNCIGVRLDAFYHSINSDNTEEFIFDEGKAFQGRIFYANKNFKVQLNYWQSDRFVSPKGEDMFQSVSRRLEKYYDASDEVYPVFASYTEPDRKLLYTTLVFHKEIFKDLYLRFQTDIFYQLNEAEIHTPVYDTHVKGQLDYSMGLYLIYKFKQPLLFPNKTLD